MGFGNQTMKHQWPSNSAAVIDIFLSESSLFSEVNGRECFFSPIQDQTNFPQDTYLTESL